MSLSRGPGTCRAEGTLLLPLAIPPLENDQVDLTPKTRLASHLRRVIQAQLPTAAGVVIEYLVGKLDEDGYLHSSLQEAAQHCGVTLEQVEQVLLVLQAQEPAGVGARDVRECLLLQLHSLEARGRHQPWAQEIIERHLADLGEQKYQQIARKLGISLQEVEEVHSFLQQQLHPFPTSVSPSDEGRGIPDQPDGVRQ